MTLLLIISFTLLGSLVSVGLAWIVLAFGSKKLSLVTSSLIPYAIGTLLGAALFGMIPHALDSLPSSTVMPTLLAGLVLFFLLEKLAVWRHCHEDPCETHTSAGTMILIGDSIHNFVDGVAIAAAFGISTSLGIATAFAVIAHEVPQEVGDFVVLLDSGFPKWKAFAFNAASSLFALVGAVFTWFALPTIRAAVPYMLAVSAASFVYIALADLVPGRRATGGLRSLAWELPLIAGGAATVFLIKAASG